MWRSIIELTDRSGSVFARSSRLSGSMLPVAQQVKVNGSDKLKQGGHTVVDNWPWPGGHLTSSSPTLFMVGY
jgi:hypothetical protein